MFGEKAALPTFLLSTETERKSGFIMLRKHQPQADSQKDTN